MLQGEEGSKKESSLLPWLLQCGDVNLVLELNDSNQFLVTGSVFDEACVVLYNWRSRTVRAVTDILRYLTYC